MSSVVFLNYIGVEHQSTWGGDFCQKIYVWKINKMHARILHYICPKEYSSRFYWENAPCPPVSHAYTSSSSSSSSHPVNALFYYLKKTEKKELY